MLYFCHPSDCCIHFSYLHRQLFLNIKVLNQHRMCDLLRYACLVALLPCCSLVAKVWTKLWSADQSAELSSLGQGSTASKPELLSVGVSMRALANLSTTVSLWLLRFDVYMPCRMASAKPSSRPRCSSDRDRGLAAACQRRQCSLWSSGHSLWSLARWTQPLWPQLWDTVCGHSFGTQPCGALRKWKVEVRIRP